MSRAEERAAVRASRQEQRQSKPPAGGLANAAAPFVRANIANKVRKAVGAPALGPGQYAFRRQLPAIGQATAPVRQARQGVYQARQTGDQAAIDAARQNLTTVKQAQAPAIKAAVKPVVRTTALYGASLGLQNRRAKKQGM